MLLSRQEDSTPVPGHVSIDNCNESSTSPVTLDSLSLSAKRHLFRDDADKTPCRIVSPGNESLDEELEAFIEHKHEEIQKCLNGELSISSPSKSGVDAKENDTVVDLWHLRQLALSKGGLLNASLRKQAWLKLVDANESILMKAITSDAITGETNPTEVLSKDIVKLSDHEINLIEEDINNCIWNLEEEISRHKSSEPNTNQGIIDEDCTNDTTSAASYESASESYNGKPLPQSAPERITTFLSSDVSNLTPNQHPLRRLGRTKNARRKKEERALLLNIITSILRTSPADVKDLGLERLFYFPGMHNVVAPLLITLESPSLTSLALVRLSMYHMKDSISPTFDNIQSAIRSIFLPLLEHFDKTLHDLLVQGGVSDPCSFAMRWVLCWFSSDITDYDIVARLFDAFIVSHHLFPIYTAVAMMTYGPNRSRIALAVEKGGGEYLAETLYGIPSAVLRNQSHRDAITSIESILETSISYIKELPPPRALELAKRNANDLVASSVSVTSKSRFRPLWTYKSFVYTDWNIIREANMTRHMSPHSRAERQRNRRAELNAFERTHCIAQSNELALGACSAHELMSDFLCKIDKPNSWSRRRFALKVFLLIGVVAYLLACFNNDVKEGPISDSKHDIMKIGALLGKVAAQFQSAQKYVLEDPDLFIIMM